MKQYVIKLLITVDPTSFITLRIMALFSQSRNVADLNASQSTQVLIEVDASADNRRSHYATSHRIRPALH